MTTHFARLARTAVAALCVALCGAAAAQTASMETRLRNLEGEAEIRRSLDDYMHLLRTRDWDNYSKLFATDSAIDIVEGVIKGKDAIKARMANASARQVAAAAGQPQRQSADILSNVYVKVDGDTATARSRFTFLSEAEDGSFRVRGSGIYSDTWVRENGVWLIKYRKVDWDLLFSAGRATAPAAPAAPASTPAK